MLFEDMTVEPYDNAELRARKAFLLYEDGKILHALLELDAAIDINPANSSWHFNKALALDSVSRFEEAIAEYKTALQLNPNDLETLNSLAVDYTRTGHYDLAIDTFEYIQKLDPEFEPAYCNRIITYTEMSKHDLAEQMFYLAQQIDPDCALCYYNIGNSLFVRGQYRKAVSCWQRTAQLEPTHPQINYRIAQAYWYEGDSARAREYFLSELRTNPGDIEVIMDYGLFLLELGDIDSAREKFNRLLELHPDSAAALFYLAEIAFNKAEYGRAVKLYNEALQKDNKLNGPYYRLAQCELKKGSKQQVTAYLLTELNLEPDDSNIVVSIGSMFLVIGDTSRAAHCMLKAVDMDPANADAYYYLGVISAKKKLFKDAAEFFSHALDINPNHLWSLRDSASVYLASGRIHEAAEKVKKAIELAGDDSHLRCLNRRIRMIQKIQQFWSLFGLGIRRQRSALRK